MVKRNVSNATRFRVFAQDNFTCRACGYTDDCAFNLTVDHIYPIAAGGSNNVENLQCLCQVCNAIKGAIVTPEFEIREPMDMSRPYQEIFDELLDNRKVFYKKLHKENKGWFGRRDKTIALINEALQFKRLHQSKKDRLCHAIEQTFDLRKKLLDFEPYIELYKNMAEAGSTPASCKCALAY